MPDDNEPEETIDEIVERKLAERVKDEERKRNRSKQPKDFGEFLDRVADAVIDRVGERRAKAEADDNTDEPPARGAGKSGFARFWEGDDS